MRGLAVALLVFAASLAGCRKPLDPALPAPPEPVGNAARGAELVVRFECNRCHASGKLGEPPEEKRCVGCHRDILESRAHARDLGIEQRWNERVATFADAPSLNRTQERFRRAWIASFLARPYDLRPSLGATMPRLPLTDADARDIAAYLVPDEGLARPDEDDDALLAGADMELGRALLEAKGCGACHRMTGAPIRPAPIPANVTIRDIPRAIALAPDLRYTRERTTTRRLLSWLDGASNVKPDTLMPDIAISKTEAKHVAAFILRARLAPLEVPAPPVRPAPLERSVAFDEVREKVLGRTCWHCHSDPDLERGDTGPGNTGGFGFPPRGIDLADYRGVLAGGLDDRGERRSLFEPMPAGAPDAGAPRIVAALMARHREERGDLSSGIRGMPLALPALPMEQIQLVVTWIAQGRRR